MAYWFDGLGSKELLLKQVLLGLVHSETVKVFLCMLIRFIEYIF